MTAALVLILLLAAPEPGVIPAGRYTIEYQPGAEKLARSIAPLLEPEMLRIAAALRVEPPPRVRVMVMDDPRAFMWRQTDRFEPWVAGLASPEQDTIYLRPLSGHEVRHNSVRAVAAHELAHLAIHRRLKGHPAPAWLDEGLAMFLADEPFYARSTQLISIALTGRAFMFRDLQMSFPTTSNQAAIAYAQSGDFVRWLFREHGEQAFLRYLDILAEGVDPDKALQAAFGLPLYDLQNQWLKSLGRLYGWIPTLTGGTFLWFLLALIAAFAYWRKWRQMRETRAELAAEEEARETVRQLAQERRRVLLSASARRRPRSGVQPEETDEDYESDDEGLNEDGTFDDDEEDFDDEEDDEPGPKSFH